MHGIFYDPIHDEIVVPVALGGAVLKLPGDAAGDAPPKRIIRNAPAGSPTVGFGNPGAVAYDSKRDELLVPN